MYSKFTTFYRPAVPAKLRLMVTLRYLTSGSNFHVLEDIFRISSKTIRQIVPETCEAMWTTLHEEHVKCPTTHMEWLEKAKKFEEKWQYPRGLGAIDGKHVQIQVYMYSCKIMKQK